MEKQNIAERAKQPFMNKQACGTTGKDFGRAADTRASSGHQPANIWERGEKTILAAQNSGLISSPFSPAHTAKICDWCSAEDQPLFHKKFIVTVIFHYHKFELFMHYGSIDNVPAR